jgi:hypothetical protein
MKENRLRVFLGEKPNKGYGARTQCEMVMKRLSKVFNESSLSRYGLKRDARTFEDLMRGGHVAKQSYRAQIEKELPVKSSISFIAEKARASVDEAVEELQGFITTLQNAGKVPSNCHLWLQPNHMQFDDETGQVVWSSEGLAAIEEVEGYYMTNERQLQVYDLAKEIVAKVEELETALQGSLYSAMGSLGGRCVLRLNCGKLEVENEAIIAIK